MEHYAIGIDLGGTNIKAALVERNAGVVVVHRIATEAEQGADHVLDRIVEIAREMIDEAPQKQVAGIGIGGPGTVNWERTSLIYPPNIPGWTEVNLRQALQKPLREDLHVIVENDANAAALGSAHYGAGRPYDAFIMITLGTGVGGAIIYQNAIFRGTTGAAGEIGHMTIDYDGPMDRAGVAGAIEAYLGQRFLIPARALSPAQLPRELAAPDRRPEHGRFDASDALAGRQRRRRGRPHGAGLGRPQAGLRARLGHQPARYPDGHRRRGHLGGG